MTKIFSLLSRYLVRHIFVWQMAVYALLLVIVYLFEVIDLTRQFAKNAQASFGLVLEMAALKLPQTGLHLVPFAVLLGGVLGLWQLLRSHQLTVIRAAGVSSRLMAASLGSLGLLLGMIHCAVLDPVASLFLQRYEVLDKRYFHGGSEVISLSEAGLWLREPYRDGAVILHAPSVTVTATAWELSQPMALVYDINNRLRYRIDATSARLEEGAWVMPDARFIQPDRVNHTQVITDYRMVTRFDTDALTQRFTAVETLSFWALPKFIYTMTQTGLNTRPMMANFLSLLLKPLFYAALMIMALGLVLQPPRMARGGPLALMTIFIGASLFFFSDFLTALGLSNKMPLVVTALAPSVIVLLAATALLIHREEV
jgi:lipopolysaccharide export system permease protein